MKKFELVIAGGGLTAARAIKSYREAGGIGRVRSSQRRASSRTTAPRWRSATCLRRPLYGVTRLRRGCFDTRQPMLHLVPGQRL